MGWEGLKLIEKKTSKGNMFLLAGNGPYLNRGCEAIVRGTMEILRREFGPNVSAKAGVIAKAEVVKEQNENEYDPAISSFLLTVPGGPRWSKGWFAAQFNQRFGANFYPQLRQLKEPARETSIALEIGGDHYSLDYGKPLNFMAMDKFFWNQGIPVVLWGASVGPFDADPTFAKHIFAHLRKFSGIFVRESESYDYLRANGVSENVHLMGDPAFLLKESKPRNDFTIPEGAVGVNLSPMLAFYLGLKPAEVDLDKWGLFCVELIKCIARLGRPIMLIPHVGSTDSGNDDFIFMNSIFHRLKGFIDVPVEVVPQGLNAAELKWLISKCSVFAGARTHSTIAAISSNVPTLSIGYSLKARGINKDTFGHVENCLPVRELSVSNFTERIKHLLDEEEKIRAHLEIRVRSIKESALNAGALLRTILEQG